MEVKILRLQTGEDIISEIKKDLDGDDRYIHLINPFKIVYYTTGIETTDRFMVSLIPWMFSSLTKSLSYKILEQNILVTAEPSEKLIVYYYEIMKRLEMLSTMPFENELKKSYSQNNDMDINHEISMMDDNEKKVTDDEYLDMVKNKLLDIRKRTLH